MKNEETNTELAILKAAEELFLEQGFEQTTTKQIAQRAGCNQALLHYYYRTKDNLFVQIFEEKVKFIAERQCIRALRPGARCSDTRQDKAIYGEDLR